MLTIALAFGGTPNADLDIRIRCTAEAVRTTLRGEVLDDLTDQTRPGSYVDAWFEHDADHAWRRVELDLLDTKLVGMRLERHGFVAGQTSEWNGPNSAYATLSGNHLVLHERRDATLNSRHGTWLPSVEDPQPTSCAMAYELRSLVGMPVVGVRIDTDKPDVLTAYARVPTTTQGDWAPSKRRPRPSTLEGRFSPDFRTRVNVPPGPFAATLAGYAGASWMNGVLPQLDLGLQVATEGRSWIAMGPTLKIGARRLVRQIRDEQHGTVERGVTTVESERGPVFLATRNGSVIASNDRAMLDDARAGRGADLFGNDRIWTAPGVHAVSRGRVLGGPFAALDNRPFSLDAVGEGEVVRMHVEMPGISTIVSDQLRGMTVPVQHQDVSMLFRDRAAIDANVPVVIGDEAAPMRVVEFVDYGSPEAARIDDDLSAIVRKHPRASLRVVDWIASGACNASVKSTDRADRCDAAYAVRCAAQQDRRSDMARAIFQSQGDFAFDSLVLHATHLGLDVPKFQGCMADPATKQAVLADAALGTAAGVETTPTLALAIGDRWVSVDFDGLDAVLEAAETGALPVPEPPRPPRPSNGITLGEPKVTGIERRLIDAALLADVEGMRACFGDDRRSRGRVVVKFVVGADGIVSETRARASSPRTRDASRCVADRIMNLRFTPPKSGFAVVEYPIEYAPPRQ